MKGSRHAVRRRKVAGLTAPSAPCRLSRYPTRTPSAVPGQVDSHPRRLTAASGPFSCALTAIIDAIRTAHPDSDGPPNDSHLIQLGESRPRWAR